MKGLRMAGITDPGKRRSNNEDAIATVPALGLAILADGMGGHLAGEVASGIAVDIVKRGLINELDDSKRRARQNGLSPEAAALKDSIELANRAIHEASSQHTEYAGMGSTIAVVLFHGNKVCIAHVGDSRVYRLRDGKLVQVTEDHSMIQELLRRGFITPEEAKLSTNKNMVTRALGVESNVEVELAEETVREGDIYLLCSDGLSDVLEDAVVEQILLRFDTEFENALEYMVTEVNAKGGPDNVSAVLVRAQRNFKRDREAVKELADAASR